MTFLIVLTACCTLLLMWFVLTPFFQEETGPALFEESGVRAGLYDQKERFLQVIRDLDLDFQTKKLSEDDYQAMRSAVSAELGEIMARLDNEIIGADSSARQEGQTSETKVE